MHSNAHANSATAPAAAAAASAASAASSAPKATRCIAPSGASPLSAENGRALSAGAVALSGDGRRGGSGASAAAAAASHSSSDKLACVEVIPTDGSNTQCFYIAVAAALQITAVPASTDGSSSELRWPELRRRLIASLESIINPQLLCSYGLPLNCDADAATMRRIKDAYLASADFVEQKWGGSLEMMLLSHYEGGQLAFRTYDSTTEQWANTRAALASVAANPPTLQMPGREAAAAAAAAAAASAPALEPVSLLHADEAKRQIVLHSCAYQGGDLSNHYEQVIFYLASGSHLLLWPMQREESAEERDRRSTLIMEACDFSRKMTIAESIEQEERDGELAAALAAVPVGRVAAAARKRPAEAAPADYNHTSPYKRSNAPTVPSTCSSALWEQKMQSGEPSLHPSLLRRVEPVLSVLHLPAGDARVEVRIHAKHSRLYQPIQFGLYATVQHSAGELVTPYGGLLSHDGDLKRMQQQSPAALSLNLDSHSRSVPNSSFVLDGLPLACMYRRPVPKSAQALAEVLQAGITPLLPSQHDFSDAQLSFFRSSAFGFMANTANKQQCNVRVLYKDVRAGDILYPIPILVATRTIQAGEEILSPYGSDASRRLLRASSESDDVVSTSKRVRFAAPSPTQSAPAAPVRRGAPRGTVRALLAGSPSQPQCLQKQRDNLDVFVRDHAAQYAALPYLPWTKDLPTHSREDVVEQRPSTLVPSIAGIYFRDTQRPPKKSKYRKGIPERGPVLYYQGLLVSEELLKRFNAAYYCPTALLLPLLDFDHPRKRGKKVQMLVIGDPTRPAAIINDGPISGRKPNCGLYSVPDTPEEKARVVIKQANGKFLVDAEVAHVLLKPGVTFTPATELLCDYGGKEFWVTSDAAHYCATCFGKDFHRKLGSPRQLILCSALTCRMARHVGCMPEQLSKEEISSSVFYCPQHLAQAEIARTTEAAAAAAGAASPSVQHRAAESLTPPSRGTGQLEQRNNAVSTYCFTPPPEMPLLSGVQGTSAVSNHYCFTPPPTAIFSPPPPSSSATAAAAAAPAISSSRRALQARFNATARAPSPTSKGHAPNSLPNHSRVSWHSTAAAAAAAGVALHPHPSHMLYTGEPSVSYATGRLETVREDIDMEAAESSDAGSNGGEDYYYCRDSASGSRSSFESGDDEAPNCSRTGSSARHRSSAPPPPTAAAAVAVKPKVQSRIRQPPLKIRTREQAMMLRNWALHYAPLTVPQREAVCALFNEGSGWWKGANAGASERASRKQAQRRGLDVSGVAAGAGLLGTASSTKRAATTNRWYDPEALADDWAEYRCCCGSPAVVAKQLVSMTHEEGVEHSSAHVLALFKARQAHRARSSNRIAFAASVLDDVQRLEHCDGSLSSTAGERTVRWDGGTVCASCYRAVVGIGRSSVFSYRHGLLKASDVAAHETGGLAVTRFGKLRKSRDRAKMDGVEELLLEYARTFGQVAPNPKGKKTRQQRVVLPHSRVSELVQALNTLAASSSAGGTSEPAAVKESTLRHVIAELKEREGYEVLVKPSKDMCRCEDCDLLDEQAAAHKDTDPALYLTKLAQKQQHLRQVKEQRDYFDAQKVEAEQKPRKKWCFTYDGMDQSKTQLPSLKGRMPKNLEPLPRLGVHAVGSFCFGGPVPVMGFLNFPDVRKDSSLSVCILDHALDIQFNKLKEMYSTTHGEAAAATHPCANRDAVIAAAAAASAATDCGSAGENQASAAPAAAVAPLDSEAPPPRRSAKYRDFGDHWPERLHVTFDNAASDAKNQFVFRYLGLLVLHGVFDAITVSTLIVGHTHDIVDQMFSVWSKLLRITDCKTYEQMRRLFHEKYHSRVRLLVKLMNGLPLSPEEACDAGIDGEEAVTELANERERDVSLWGAAAQSYAERLNTDLDCEAAAFNCKANSAGAGEGRGSSSCAGPSSSSNGRTAGEFHTPHMVRQEYSFNIRSWMESMVWPSGKNMFKEYPMVGQTNPHVFAVEKDADGDVYLYNKFLAKSTEKSQRGETHKFLCKTGRYTARCLLFRAGDRPYTKKAPVANPPEIIEVDQLRDTIAAYVAQGKLNSAEQQEWDTLLSSFEQAQQKLGESCAQCASLIEKLNEIGVVSNKKDMSSAEHEIQNGKRRDRLAERTALSQHLQTPHAPSASMQAMPDFLGKWLTRVQQHIYPSYLQRGVQAPEEYRTMDYHSHPATLCTDGRSVRRNPDNLIFDTDGRVDHECLRVHGPPLATQFVLARCANSREPIGFGLIHRVLGAGEVPDCTRGTTPDSGGLTLDQLDSLLSGSLSAEPAPAAAAAVAAVAGPSGAAPQFESDAAASASLPVESFDRAHRSDKRRVAVDLEVLPNLMVEWFSYADSDVRNLHLLENDENEQWWQEQARVHAAADAATAAQLGHTPPAREWVVDLFKEVRFRRLTPKDRRVVLVQGSELILWHNDKNHCLTAEGKLKAAIFAQVRFDLTERAMPRPRTSRARPNVSEGGNIGRQRGAKRGRVSKAAAGAAAAAAATPAMGVGSEGAAAMDVDDDGDSAFVPDVDAPTAAAAAAAARPRRTHCSQPVVEAESSDSSDEQEGVRASAAKRRRVPPPAARSRLVLGSQT